MGKEILRYIPPVNDILGEKEIRELLEEIGREMVTEEINVQQDKLRQEILAGEDKFIFKEASTSEVEYRKILIDILVDRVRGELKERISPKLKRVINATGTVIHTNLGRAPLAREVCQELSTLAGSYNNLELDLDSGERGQRYEHVEELLKGLTGAEDALVVNNNAAAVMLVLHNLAEGKEVVISRGELVEIGGSFRVPEVMKQSGAILKEIGTTNKTHLEDYEKAIGEETAMLLSVHTSNYKIIGFTQKPTLEELESLSKAKNIPLVKDLGSGLLYELEGYDEPTVTEVLSKGVDIVTFSGDKLLGGPQGGIIVGKRKWINRLKKDQLTRALRIDKLTLKALESTLRLYLNPEKARCKIPVLAALKLTEGELKERAKNLAEKLDNLLMDKGYKVEIEDDTSRVGGGAMPEEELPTRVVVLKNNSDKLEKLNYKLRQHEPPVMLRFKGEKLLIDPRTLLEGELEELPEIISGLA